MALEKDQYPTEHIAVLGLPSIGLLWRLFCRCSRRPYVFFHRPPLWLRLCPLARIRPLTGKRYEELVLKELTHFAKALRGTPPVLMITGEAARRFASLHRETLERSFILTTADGGIL